MSPDVVVVSTDEKAGLSAEGLSSLMEARNVELLKQMGGVASLASRLGVDIKLGLAGEIRKVTQARFGKNKTPSPPSPSLLRMMIGALNDRMLLLLMAAAVISLSIGIYRDVHDKTYLHWIEGAAILAAVVIVVLANALNDYQREIQFRMLSARAEDRLVKVFHEGRPTEISIFALAVGDILLFEPGVRLTFVCKK